MRARRSRTGSVTPPLDHGWLFDRAVPDQRVAQRGGVVAVVVGHPGPEVDHHAVVGAGGGVDAAGGHGGVPALACPRAAGPGVATAAGEATTHGDAERELDDRADDEQEGGALHQASARCRGRRWPPAAGTLSPGSDSTASASERSSNRSRRRRRVRWATVSARPTAMTRSPNDSTTPPTGSGMRSSRIARESSTVSRWRWPSGPSVTPASTPPARASASACTGMPAFMPMTSTLALMPTRRTPMPTMWALLATP